MLTVDFRSDPTRFADTEPLYLAVRQAEGRILSPEALRRLPEVATDDPHAGEWNIRAVTTRRLVRHLRSGQSRPHILDLGCGPGWMTARLVRELKGTAVGIDSSQSELERGAEAFSSVEGLRLVYGDIFEPVVQERSFDAVVMASALQYFPDVEAILERLLKLLKPGGEILVADTPLYQCQEIPAAAARTLDYYTELGFPQMADHYHHHAFDELAAFSPEILYDPRAILSRISRTVFLRPLSPFPILRISRPENP